MEALIKLMVLLEWKTSRLFQELLHIHLTIAAFNKVNHCFRLRFLTFSSKKTHDCMQRNVLDTRAVEHIRLVFVSKVLSPQWKVSMHYYTITEQPRSNVRLKMRACDWLVCMTSSYILHPALSSMDSFSLCFSFFPITPELWIYLTALWFFYSVPYVLKRTLLQILVKLTVSTLCNRALNFLWP